LKEIWVGQFRRGLDPSSEVGQGPFDLEPIGDLDPGAKDEADHEHTSNVSDSKPRQCRNDTPRPCRRFVGHSLPAYCLCELGHDRVSECPQTCHLRVSLCYHSCDNLTSQGRAEVPL